MSIVEVPTSLIASAEHPRAAREDAGAVARALIGGLFSLPPSPEPVG